VGEVIKESNAGLENEVVKPLWATKKNVVGPAFGSAADDPDVWIRLRTERHLIFPCQLTPSGAIFEKPPLIWVGL